MIFLPTERAKNYWAEQDLDQVFDCVSVFLIHLKQALKKEIATDRGQNCLLYLISLMNCQTCLVVSFSRNGSSLQGGGVSGLLVSCFDSEPSGGPGGHWYKSSLVVDSGSLP